MRFIGSKPDGAASICLALYGCGQLDRVTRYINEHPTVIDEAGVRFTAGQLAGQYAFERAKLDRKGYDSRRLTKYLSILSDAGAKFDLEEALAHADELINNFTADYGQDEDGDATFRIRAQSFRLKKYDCHALRWRVRLAKLQVTSVSTEEISLEDAYESESDDNALDLRIACLLSDPQGEPLASMVQYVTVENGRLFYEDLLDYELLEYPNFHDESESMQTLMQQTARRFRQACAGAVQQFLEQRLPAKSSACSEMAAASPKQADTFAVAPQVLSF